MFALDLPTQNVVYLVLYLATLVLHVVAMNYVVGGAMVVAGAAVFKLFVNYCDATEAIVAKIKDWLPLALGVTIALGVAPILFVQILYKHSFYTANLLLFYRWMAILPVLIVAFYLLYLQKSNWIERRGRVVHAIVAGGVLAMFLFVAWSWTENHLLSFAGQTEWTDHYVAGRMRYRSIELLPRLTVWMIGALTTLSVLLAWQLRGRATTATVRRLALIGVCGAVGSLAAGGWYWLVLPGDVVAAVMQPANLIVLVIAGAGVLATIGAWGHMAKSGRLGTPWMWLATAGLGAAIPAATVLREVRRYVALVDVDQWQTAVDTASQSASWQGFGVFALFLVANVAAIWWLIRKVRCALRSLPSSNALAARGAASRPFGYLVYKMPKLGHDQFFHCQPDGGRGAWHGEDDRAVADAADCAAKHGGRADFFVAQHAKEFSVPRKCLGKQPGNGFAGPITR